ncbi:MAG: hypothetical protein Fur0021_21170 [Candidatus Promineifilaceae bacterium]
MLGAEKEIVETYVPTGQVKVEFSPILDLGPNSLNAAAAAYCAGFQNPMAFWELHDTFFANQGEVFRADRDYFVNAAAATGVDQAAFASCYDGGEAHALVSEHDNARRRANISIRPTIDVNGQLLFGAQPFAAFAQVIEAALP